MFLENKLPVQFHPSLQFICAAGAMIACSFIMVPGEVIKIRLQAGLCSTMTEGITQTLKQDGIGGLFAGKSFISSFLSVHMYYFFIFMNTSRKIIFSFLYLFFRSSKIKMILKKKCAYKDKNCLYISIYFIYLFTSLFCQYIIYFSWNEFFNYYYNNFFHYLCYFYKNPIGVF